MHLTVSGLYVVWDGREQGERFESPRVEYLVSHEGTFRAQQRTSSWSQRQELLGSIIGQAFTLSGRQDWEGAERTSA